MTHDISAYKVKRITPNLNSLDVYTGSTNLSRIEVESRLKNLFAKPSFVSVSLTSHEFSDNVNNANFWRGKLILEWIQKNVGKGHFLVSDAQYRYYNQILCNFDERTSLEKGLYDGKKFISDCKSNIIEIGLDINQFDFFKWSEIMNNEKFIYYHDFFKNEYCNNEQLKLSILESADAFLARNVDRIMINIEKAKLLSISTIIEELAMFTYMGDIGFASHLYPATFMKVLKDISAGRINNMPKSLSDQILVQIKIVKK